MKLPTTSLSLLAALIVWAAPLQAADTQGMESRAAALRVTHTPAQLLGQLRAAHADTDRDAATRERELFTVLSALHSTTEPVGGRAFAATLLAEPIVARQVLEDSGHQISQPLFPVAGEARSLIQHWDRAHWYPAFRAALDAGLMLDFQPGAGAELAAIQAVVSTRQWRTATLGARWGQRVHLAMLERDPTPRRLAAWQAAWQAAAVRDTPGISDVVRALGMAVRQMPPHAAIALASDLSKTPAWQGVALRALGVFCAADALARETVLAALDTGNADAAIALADCGPAGQQLLIERMDAGQAVALIGLNHALRDDVLGAFAADQNRPESQRRQVRAWLNARGPGDAPRRTPMFSR